MKNNTTFYHLPGTQNDKKGDKKNKYKSYFSVHKQLFSTLHVIIFILILQAKQIYMQKIKQYIFSRKYVLILVFLFFLIRLPFLDSTFLLYDERDTILTQYSIAKTGKDLYGNQTPLVFSRISPQAPVLAMYYGVPFWSMNLPLNITTARFLYLLPTTLLPLLVFELLYAFTKEKKVSLLTSLIFSFSPWLFHISRLAVEINIAFPLFLIALILQVKKKYLFSYIFYILTFFTYQGIRPLIPILFIYIEFFLPINKTGIKYRITHVVSLLLLFCLLFFIGLRFENNFLSRGSSEIVFFAGDRLKNEVDFSRSLTHINPLITNIFHNKIFLTMNYLVGNFFEGLNLTYLFKSGDYLPIYSNGVTGQFLPFLFLFFLLGLLYLGKKNTCHYYFPAGISLIGLISSIINIYSVSFSIRSLTSGIGLSFIMSLGIVYGYKCIKNYQYILKYIIITFAGLIIFFQISNFIYQYTFIRPIIQAELFNETERKLAKLLISKTRSTVYLSNPFAYFLSYIFIYQPDENDMQQIQQILKTQLTEFKFNNIVFKQCNIGEKNYFSPPNNTIIDSICLSDKTKTLLKTKGISSYDTIPFSDLNSLRPTNEVKFYVFN